MMKSKAQTQTQSLRVLPRVISLSLLVALSISTVQAQSNRAINKEDFIAALELGKKAGKTVEVFIELVKKNGVSFLLVSQEDEQQIRQAGSYLGSRALDELIKVLSEHYRPYRGERLRVSLFNYIPCSEHQEQFTELLQSKVNALPGRLIASNTKSRYIKDLKLVSEGKPFRLSGAQADRYWETTHSLQILAGTCTKQDNGVVFISHVFLGDLRGPLASPLRIEFKMDPQEYGDTRDIHSLLILYSLAKDAQARALDRNLIIEYLAEASGIAAQLVHPEHLSTLQPITSAIEGMLRDLGAADLYKPSDRKVQ